MTCSVLLSCSPGGRKESSRSCVCGSLWRRKTCLGSGRRRMGEGDGTVGILSARDTAVLPSKSAKKNAAALHLRSCGADKVLRMLRHRQCGRRTQACQGAACLALVWFLPSVGGRGAVVVVLSSLGFFKTSRRSLWTSRSLCEPSLLSPLAS